MKKEFVVGGVILFLVLTSFVVLEKKITGNVTSFGYETCDETYVEEMWNEIFSVGFNASSYVNEVTNADGSKNCEGYSYHLLGDGLYVLVLNSKNSDVKEELNYSAYYANLSTQGKTAWNSVNKNDKTQINLFFNEGDNSWWALRATQLDEVLSQEEYSAIFIEPQGDEWTYSSEEEGYNMYFNNYTILVEGNQDTNLWTYLMRDRQLAILNYRDVRVENGSWFRPIGTSTISSPSVNKNTNYTFEVENYLEGFTSFNMKTQYTNQTNNLTIVLNQTGKTAELKPKTDFVGTIYLNLTATNYYENISILFSLIVKNTSVSENNTIPNLTKEFPDISFLKNTNYSLNVSGYFNDSDGDDLGYTYRRGPNISVSVNSTILKISPEKDFVGESWLMVVADDGIDIKSSNKIIVNVYANISQQMQNSTNQTNQTMNLSQNSSVNSNISYANLEKGEVKAGTKEKIDTTLLRYVVGGLAIIFIGLIGIVILKRKEFFGQKVEPTQQPSVGYSNV
jgi:hypothetical protein